MRKKIALIVMCIGIFIAGCSNQSENPSDDKILDNETKAPVVESEAPSVVPSESPSEVPSEPEPTMEGVVAPTKEAAVETEEPSEVPEPTVEPTKEPTKAPVTKEPTKAPATKTPTKKPVTTKTPTKAPATKAPTKKPTATKTPNAAGEPYKVGNVTVTPVTGVTMWSKNQGYIRTKPWTSNTLDASDYDFDWKDVKDKHSVILGWQYYNEIKVTGICSNGFIQYWVNDANLDYKGYVYTHKDQLFTEKPKEFTYKGYDPVEDIIKPALKKLKAEGFTISTDGRDANIKISLDNVAKNEAILKQIEEGTYPFPDNWSQSRIDEFKAETEELLEQAKQGVESAQDYYDWLLKYEPITEEYVGTLGYESLSLNKNLNRVDVHPSVATAGVKTTQDMVNLIVEEYKFNRDNETGRDEYVWIHYREVKEDGETYYRFYLI